MPKKPVVKKSATKTVVAKKTAVKKTAKKSVPVQPVVAKITFAQAVKDYWSGYVDFRGLTSRRGFWLAFLFCWIVGMIGGVLGGIIDAGLALAMFLPSMALGVRRYHDAGFSGWWYVLLALVQSVLAVYTFSHIDVAANTLGVQQMHNIWPYLAAEFILGCVNVVILLLPSKVADNKYRK